ncbi:hypothetical protein DC3_28790 [Deinococcus cellulosilyticus NBRC 106333 = KACC 11606]|uniref:Glycoside hydrolase family 38 N-terminal domain-containing protein n=2 Tax=Deinococcus cellulosilyticus TaxID=401558 RepID=A0A511N313_DEIC1|nr:hypothetical protein DC3_28790 [Deinococcus cellulosilyticus NBRC 106333 = KACC 11606]
MLVFEIGAGDLLDNYKHPRITPETPYLAGSGASWPIYQASEADPEAGYQLYPREILFELPADLHPSGYLLEIEYLVIAPRYPHLRASINGFETDLYLNPRASQSGEIRLLSGLHTTIYADGTLRTVLPPGCVHEGINRLTLTAVDGEEVLFIDNLDRITRLDRMANGAGLIYQSIRLTEAESIEVSVQIVPTVLYREEKGELLNRIDGIVNWNRGSAPFTVLIDGVSYEIEPEPTHWGQSRFSVWTSVKDEVFECQVLGFTGRMKRARKWTVYMATHSHTDIGYTHRQIEVAERQNRNLDSALKFIAAGDLFSYHLDSVWPLESYTESRSQTQRKQLSEQMQAGHIHAAQNYADLLTHFAALEDLIHNQTLGQKMLSMYGVSSKLAAVVDVASITQALPDVLSRAGVRYLIHANNQDHGPFRLNGRLNTRCPFWWQGPAGGKVLYWLAKMYCELRKVCGSPPVLSSAERGLNTWLSEYERDDYLPDAVLLYGQEADNTDIDPQPNRFVQLWNDTYVYPKLLPTDPTHFFEHIEERWGEQLETVTGDGGAYWEDGVITSLQETLQARQAQADLPAAEQLDALAALHDATLQTPAGFYDQAWHELLLYDEHTWGAFLSVTDSDAILQKDQWDVKKAFAATAQQKAKQLLHAAASRNSLQWNTRAREVVVYNPHNFTMTSDCNVEIALHEGIFDGDTRVPFREVSRTATQKVIQFSTTLEGFSYRRFQLRPAPEPQKPFPAQIRGLVMLETPHYQVHVDADRARILQITDLESGQSLLSSQGAGSLVYVTGGEGSRITSNQADLPDAELTLHDGFQLHEGLLVQDALGSTLTLKGQHFSGPLTFTLHLPENQKAVLLDYQYSKTPTLSRESAYVQFDLADIETIKSDAQIGWVDWETDTLPGACQEWLPLQTGILKTGGIPTLIASPDIPLFCIGDVVRGHWPVKKDQRTGPVCSYLLNNYWHTNYLGKQGGNFHFRYLIASGNHLTEAEAHRIGWATRRPLYAHRISFQDFREELPVYQDPRQGYLLKVTGDVHVRTMQVQDDLLTLRLQSITSHPQTAHIELPDVPQTVHLTDLHGGFLQEIPTHSPRIAVSLPALDLVTLKIHLRRKR